MRHWFAIIIGIGLIGVAVFGFVGMQHSEHGNGHASKCIASVSTGADCAQTADSFSFAAFHARTFQSYSQAVFAHPAILFAIILVALTVLTWLDRSGSGVLRYKTRSWGIFFKPLDTSSSQKSIDWLALLEKRDPALLT